MTMTDVQRVLLDLDRADDSQWTEDGLPRLDVVKKKLGRSITREELTDAAPTFRREDAPTKWAEDALDAEQQVDRESQRPDRESPVPEPPPPIESVEMVAEFDVGHVDSEDDVVAMDPREVFSSPELVVRAINEFARQDAELCKRLSRINESRQRIAATTHHLEKVRGRMRVDAGDRERIARYQEAQRREREERVRRARAFVEAGTTQEAVIDQIDPRSRLDRVMGARKSARGRPQFSPRSQ